MKYGLLLASTANLGDDIQALAAKQFLPRVDIILDRDFLDSIESDEKIKVLMNGWFTHRPDNWPPSPVIEPYFISFHISPIVADRLLNKKTIEYLRKYEPIGCRDVYTKELLESKGVKAYFSGCLTLTLDYNYSQFKRLEEPRDILIVDIDNSVIKYLPKHVLESAKFVTHAYFKPSAKLLHNIIPPVLREAVKKTLPFNFDKLLYNTIDRPRAKRLSFEERLKKAEEQLQRIASAKLVITSRLHAALPALGFGTPVIFVHRNLNDPRFTGLLQFLNHYSVPEFKKQVEEIDWENPPQNPRQEELNQLKKRLIEKCEDFIKE